PAGSRDHAAATGRTRRDRGPTRDALPPLPARRGRNDSRRLDRPTDLSEPARDRGGPESGRRAPPPPPRRGADAPLRAGDPQPRSLPLVLDALLGARGRSCLIAGPPRSWWPGSVTKCDATTLWGSWSRGSCALVIPTLTSRFASSPESRSGCWMPG